MILAPAWSGIAPNMVLVGMEASGVIRDAFRARGISAWSCDLRPCEADPACHFTGDVFELISWGWRCGIFHPDCTFLTGAAEWAQNDPDFERYPGVGYHQKPKPETKVGAERRAAREKAIADFIRCETAPIDMVAVENPPGAISKAFRKPDQTLTPPNTGTMRARKYLFGSSAFPSCGRLAGFTAGLSRPILNTCSAAASSVGQIRRTADRTTSRLRPRDGSRALISSPELPPRWRSNGATG